MPKTRKHIILRRCGLTLAALSVLLFMTPVNSASAQNIFQMLFGGHRYRSSAPPPPPARGFGDPSEFGEGGERRSEGGTSGAYCVRLCDGRPFPVQSSGISPAQACSAFCPASQTKVFSGSSIDHAVSTDGKRYSSLPNAFVYRTKLVDGCTCNGRKPGGLAAMSPRNDPTLRAGDLVASSNGLVVYKGTRNDVAEFSPVQDRRLSQIQVAPAAAQARAQAPQPAPEPPAPRDGRRRSQSR